MKKHDRLPDFSKLCAPEQTPISFFLSQQIYFFFLGSIGGFLWEVAIFLYRDKTFANRGFLYGPWLPVYGIGAVLFYLLLGCRRKKIHPAGVFFLSAAIGTGLELLIGWFLDAFWNLRYWDYSGYPFHFHGYICLYAAVGFGIAGVLWICVLEAPLTRLWSIRELDEKAKEQGISGRTMRDVRSRMKNELEYRVNEKQENSIRLKE